MVSSPIAFVFLTACLVAAAAIDLRTRRVPNVLTLSLTAAGLGCAAAGVGSVSFRSAVLAFFVGLALMLPGYVFGATGAGDVKLLAAAGTLLGVPHVVTAFLYAAIAGGAMALVIAVQRRSLASTVSRTRQLVLANAGATAAIGYD